LNEAKNTGDAKASARIFNDMQYKIYQLQPINGGLDKLFI